MRTGVLLTLWYCYLPYARALGLENFLYNPLQYHTYHLDTIFQTSELTQISECQSPPAFFRFLSLENLFIWEELEFPLL